MPGKSPRVLKARKIGNQKAAKNGGNKKKHLHKPKPKPKGKKKKGGCPYCY